MELKYGKESLQKLANIAKDTARAAAGMAQAGAARVTEAVSDAKSAVQLRRAIADLQEEIDLQMQAVGEMVYSTHRGTPSDSDVMQQILEYVDSLYEDQDAYRRQLRTLQGAHFCPQCGAENEQENTFCTQCGHALKDD